MFQLARTSSKTFRCLHVRRLSALSNPTESPESLETILSNTSRKPVVTSYFPRPGAVLIRNLPSTVKTGQAVELRNRLRGVVCGLDSVNGQGMIGLIDRTDDSSLRGISVKLIDSSSTVNAVKIEQLVK